MIGFEQNAKTKKSPSRGAAERGIGDHTGSRTQYLRNSLGAKRQTDSNT